MMNIIKPLKLFNITSKEMLQTFWDQHLYFKTFITLKDYYDSQWDGTFEVICHNDLWGANFLVKPDSCSVGHEDFTDCSGSDNVQLGIENSFQ